MDIKQRHKDILNAIADYTAEHKYAPAVREVAELVGISTTTLHGYLERLQTHGYVEWQPSRPRTLRVINRADNE